MRLIHLIFLSVFVCSIPASAQAPKTGNAPTGAPAAEPPPPVSADPQATSAAYGDWVLVCQKLAEPSTERACEVTQAVQVQGQPGPIAQIAIHKGKAQPASNVTVVLPSNVTLASGPRISVDEKDAAPVQLVWARCLPGGCFATAEIKDDVLSKWRPLNDRGRLEFRDGVGRTIVVPFSFRGLGVAYDALAKQ